MSLEFSDLEANKQSSLISQITNMLQSMYQMPLPPKNSTTAPSYYGDYVIKPIDFIVNNDIPFAEGCIIKYVVRWKQKNGVEDLKKAKVYLDKLIKLDEKQSNKKDNIYAPHIAI
jgi:hypothetical protein